MTKWAFVDYENVGSLREPNLSGYERVVVFCGPKNTNIKLDSWHGELTLIKVKSTGKNNLDFHLAFHLGRHHETADRAIEFHVVSKDQGFDGIVSHFKKLGRVCRRIGTEPQTVAKLKPKLVPKKPIEDLSETALLIVGLLNRGEAKSWPSKKLKSLNQIRSFLRVSHPDLDPEPVFTELLATGIVQENDVRLAWNEEKVRSAARPPLDEAA
jgi:hypothetical protein